MEFISFNNKITVDKNNGLYIYPNPAKNVIHVDCVGMQNYPYIMHWVSLCFNKK
jgi:hypothetical protein